MSTDTHDPADMGALLKAEIDRAIAEKRFVNFAAVVRAIAEATGRTDNSVNAGLRLALTRPDAEPATVRAVCRVLRRRVALVPADEPAVAPKVLPVPNGKRKARPSKWVRDTGTKEPRWRWNGYVVWEQGRPRDEGRQYGAALTDAEGHKALPWFGDQYDLRGAKAACERHAATGDHRAPGDVDLDRRV